MADRHIITPGVSRNGTGRAGLASWAKRWLRTVVGPASYDEVGIAFRSLGRGAPKGWIVDVGANIGDSSRPFAERGWRVLAVEPDPDHRPSLDRLASEFPLVAVDGRAVSLEDGDELTLYRSSVSSGISTLSAFHSSHEAGPLVNTVRLDSLLADRGIDDVTFLKTDTEGYDLFALQSFPWQTTRPRIVVSEFENRKTRKLGYTMDTMAAYLRSEGYTVFISEWYPIVEYGTEHRWKAIHRYPSAAIDEDSWGNLIAVEPQHAPIVYRLARLAGYQLRLRRALDPIRHLKSRV